MKRLWKLLRVLFRPAKRLRPVEVELRLRRYARERDERFKGYAETWDRAAAKRAQAEAADRRSRFYTVGQ